MQVSYTVLVDLSKNIEKKVGQSRLMVRALLDPIKTERVLHKNSKSKNLRIVRKVTNAYYQ